MTALSSLARLETPPVPAPGDLVIDPATGCAGSGLRVEVRNRLPVGGALAGESADGLPGSGLGLVSLAERVALAGGSLAHGPDDGGDFVLTAAFPWEH